MHTVIGGKHAPAAAARVKASHIGAAARRTATNPASAAGNANAQLSNVALGP